MRYSISIGVAHSVRAKRRTPSRGRSALNSRSQCFKPGRFSPRLSLRKITIGRQLIKNYLSRGRSGSNVMVVQHKRYTADDLWDISHQDDEKRYELDEGVLIELPLNGDTHGELA